MSIKTTQYDPKIKIFAAAYDKASKQPYLLVYNLNEEIPESITLIPSTHRPGCIKFDDLNGLKIFVGTKECVHVFEAGIERDHTARIIPYKNIPVPPNNHRIKAIEVFTSKTDGAGNRAGKSSKRMILAGRRRNYYPQEAGLLSGSSSELLSGLPGLPPELTKAKEKGWSEFYLLDPEENEMLQTYKINRIRTGGQRISRNQHPLSTTVIDDLLLVNSDNGASCRDIHNPDNIVYEFEATKRFGYYGERITSICTAVDREKRFLFAVGTSLYRFVIPDKIRITDKILIPHKKTSEETEAKGRTGTEENCRITTSEEYYTAQPSNHIAIGKEGNTRFVITAGHNIITAHNINDAQDYFELRWQGGSAGSNTGSATSSKMGYEISKMSEDTSKISDGIKNIAALELEDRLGVFASTTESRIYFWLLDEPETPAMVFKAPEKPNYSIDAMAVARIDTNA